MNEIRFIDLFSGIGGFRKGLQQAGGYRCVWSNDFNKYANQVYTRNFGEENHVSTDIRRVNPAEIPAFDLLCAGFPCQSFSVAGKRKGFQETRGTLFFEICRIVEDKRPSLLLLENVKGLLNHDGGRTFTIILQSLDELGYWLEWQVLNSKYHGLSQTRDRVFIVGHLRGQCGREVFPVGEVHQDRPKPNQAWQRRQIGATLTGRSAGGQNARGNYVLTLQDDSTALDSNYWKGPDRHGQRTIIIDYFNRSIREDEIFNTLKTNQGSPSSGAVIINENLKLRRLTPIECERLQGFPDGWTSGLSDTQRYKCLGNAVSVNVIEFLGKRLKEAFDAMS